MMEPKNNKWNILCLKLDNGNVSPLAKTKRDLSTKEIRRECRKFRNDDDFVGGWVYPQSRLGLNETELRQLPTI